MTLESITNLRKYIGENMIVEEPWLERVDDIEREIEERYMLFPVDENGIPIRIGDVMTAPGEDCWTVLAVGHELFVTDSENGDLVIKNPSKWSHCRQEKPTIEDILRELVRAHFNAFAAEYDGMDHESPDEIIIEYANKLREAVRSE